MANRRIRLKCSSVFGYVKTWQTLLRRVHLNTAGGDTQTGKGRHFVDDEQFEVLESGCLWDEALPALIHPANARDSS